MPLSGSGNPEVVDFKEPGFLPAGQAGAGPIKHSGMIDSDFNTAKIR